ncbi:MAG UNVERIFIED_CONTAM: hypothetical protein LVR29_31105 [Microcystis novacekii LVE1205-3]
MSYLTFRETIERSGLSRSTIKNLIRRSDWIRGCPLHQILVSKKPL